MVSKAMADDPECLLYGYSADNLRYIKSIDTAIPEDIVKALLENSGGVPDLVNRRANCHNRRSIT
jgi:hypothetical protein